MPTNKHVGTSREMELISKVGLSVRERKKLRGRF